MPPPPIDGTAGMSNTSTRRPPPAPGSTAAMLFATGEGAVPMRSAKHRVFGIRFFNINCLPVSQHWPKWAMSKLGWGGVGGQFPRIMCVFIYIHIRWEKKWTSLASHIAVKPFPREWYTCHLGPNVKQKCHSELAGGGRGSVQYIPFCILNATPIDKKL